MGGVQYKGHVALTAEMGRVWVLVAGVGLFGHTFRVCMHFMGPTGHITLGVESGHGTSVILEGAAIGTFNTPDFHGYQTTWALRVLFFQLLKSPHSFN